MITITGITGGFILMLALMALGAHVAVAIFSVATVGALMYLTPSLLFNFGNNLWGTLNDFLLTAIPLFILLGELLLRSGITERMYSALSSWLQHLPGGLLHTNIGASSVFAAMSGSSVATAATIGTVALPAFQQRGYSERMALGSLAAGATLGILIPPSINMIIYGPSPTPPSVSCSLPASCPASRWRAPSCSQSLPAHCCVRGWPVMPSRPRPCANGWPHWPTCCRPPSSSSL